ncbi:MAG: pyridoxamine 5'-phosphate oxidase family protein [Campylobacteraceae bacterium]|nr:pyridoxamine 5'-phosphate oxidase family protein [Campylobacteraceae bacterium]
MNQEIITFIKEHHIVNISSCEEGKTWSASCFYAFLEEKRAFVFASDKNTRHMKNIAKNPFVSGTITLETKEVGLIRGLQLEGSVKKASMSGKKLYFQTYPFALALFPTLWEINITYAKFTDNRLGFGKKIEYKAEH